MGRIRIKKAAAKESWVRDLPYSRMVYPDTWFDRVKYIFWHLYTPHHSIFRDLALTLGLVHHEGRQHYLLGTVAPHLSIREFTEMLIGRGYANHFVAWEDEGEIVSLRRTDGFAWQYHVRVFEDREVRAHYEYSPECYPISHMKAEHMQDRREYFLDLLGDSILPADEGK